MGESGPDRNEYISRMGTFFLLLGVLLMVIFIASDMGEVTYFRYFFFATVSILIGVFFKRITAKPPKPGTRFNWFRNLRQRQRDAAKKREEAKKKKK